MADFVQQEPGPEVVQEIGNADDKAVETATCAACDAVLGLELFVFSICWSRSQESMSHGSIENINGPPALFQLPKIMFLTVDCCVDGSFFLWEGVRQQNTKQPFEVARPFLRSSRIPTLVPARESHATLAIALAAV